MARREGREPHGIRFAAWHLAQWLTTFLAIDGELASEAVETVDRMQAALHRELGPSAEAPRLREAHELVKAVAEAFEKSDERARETLAVVLRDQLFNLDRNFAVLQLDFVLELLRSFESTEAVTGNRGRKRGPRKGKHRSAAILAQLIVETGAICGPGFHVRRSKDPDPKADQRRKTTVESLRERIEKALIQRTELDR